MVDSESARGFWIKHLLRRRVQVGISAHPGAGGASPAEGWGTVAEMIGTALRPIGHLAAWIVWHTTRVSLLSDLERPRPPHAG
jgi:hypothetical protein